MTRCLAGMLLGVMAIAALPAGIPIEARAAGTETWLSGSQFQGELDKPCVALFREKPIRDALRDLSRQLRMALVLDRRIDPTRPVTLGSEPQSLREAIGALAEQAGLGFSEVGDTFYLGPPETARLLRTVAELRRQELAGLPAKRRIDLAKGRAVGWSDLESSGDVLGRIARGAGLKVLGGEAVPDDLLWGETFGNASTAEALTLFLAQFGLGFEWQEGGGAIRLAAFPASAALERPHPVPADRRGEILARIKTSWPDVAATETGGAIRFAGLFEQHQEVEGWIRPEGPAAAPGNRSPKGKGDLSRKRLTLRVVQTPAREVLKNLEVTGLSFQVAKEVDLDARLSFELKDAAISRVIEEIAKQLGAEADLDKTVVRMRPARTPSKEK